MGLSVHLSEILSICRHKAVGSLWTKLLLQFFESLQVLLSWSEEGFGVIISLFFFFINFYRFFDLVLFRSDYY